MIEDFDSKEPHDNDNTDPVQQPDAEINEQNIPTASVALEYAKVPSYDAEKLIKIGKLYNSLNLVILFYIVANIFGRNLASPVPASAMAVPWLAIILSNIVALIPWLIGLIISIRILKTLEVATPWIILNSVVYVLCCILGGTIASHMAHSHLKKSGFKPGFSGLSKKQIEQIEQQANL